VERNYYCTACGKDFKVMNDEPESHEVEEGDLDVHCVYCQVSKRIKWPREDRYIVAIKKSHTPTLPMPVTM
jgi:DNA-directed RNA polymerase subunit RPC12/RpoP